MSRNQKITHDEKIGDIKTSAELGYNGNGFQKYMWSACLDCGIKRWVRLEHGELSRLRCRSCSNYRKTNILGHNNPSWKGGRNKGYDGYIQVYLGLDDVFFASMAYGRRYVPEHRLIMAKHLGRCLQPWELVHHKNGVKDDNRIENLELTTSGAHTLAHNKGYKDGYLQGYNDGKNKIIVELRKRIKELELQVEEGENV